MSKSTDRYVIVCTSMLGKQDEGMPLFWSNKLGWVTLSGADVFSVEDTTKLNLPLEGDWVTLPTVLTDKPATEEEKPHINKFSNSYIEGKEMWVSGVPMNQCPYPSGSVDEMLWVSGWLTARLEG